MQQSASLYAILPLQTMEQNTKIFLGFFHTVQALRDATPKNWWRVSAERAKVKGEKEKGETSVNTALGKLWQKRTVAADAGEQQIYQKSAA